MEGRKLIERNLFKEPIEIIKDKKFDDLNSKNKLVSLKGHSMAVSSLLVFKNLNRIVSCSGWGNEDFSKEKFEIRIWDSLTYKLVKDIRNHKHDVNDLVQWNDNLFLSCSDDTKILCHNVEDGYLVKQFLFNKCEVFKLEKISDELFISRNREKNIFVIHFEKNEVLKRFYVGDIGGSEMHVSKKYPNSFWINTFDSKLAIKLVDYKKELVTKELKSHNPKHPIFSICNFLNSKNEEIVIGCIDANSIYLYNTSFDEYDCQIPFDSIKNWTNKIFENVQNAYSCCVFNDAKYSSKYLIMGDYVGCVNIFEIHEGCGREEYLEQKRRIEISSCEVIYDIGILFYCDDLFRISVGTHKKNVQVIEFQEFDLPINIERMDFKERLTYITNLLSSDCKDFILRIKLYNVEILSFKSILAIIE